MAPGLTFDPRQGWAESDRFTFIGRVEKFREEDASPEHKERIGANPDTFIGQIVVEISGVDVRWVGEDGNLRRWTGDRYNYDGSQKTRRGGKASQMLEPLYAPVDADAARQAGFRKRDPSGRVVGAPGLGLKPEDYPGEFPEAAVEGHQYLVEIRRIEFGLRSDTDEPIATYIPVLLELKDDYVHEGEPRAIPYGAARTSEEGVQAPAMSPADDVGPGPHVGVPTKESNPHDFLSAIEGARFDFHAMYEAIKDSGLDQEPWRTLVVNDEKRQALFTHGFIALNEDKTITLVGTRPDALSTEEFVEVLEGEPPEQAQPEESHKEETAEE